MKTYLEIVLEVTGQRREQLIAILSELGCHGFQETDHQLLAYVDKAAWGADKSDALAVALQGILQTVSSNLLVRTREITEENWNEQWERSLQPVEIGSRIVIKPSWTTYKNTAGRIVITIDPKMSFGTGYHETTRLTLQLLEEYIRQQDRVLDVGTGTGVLAVAAVLLGASSAYGTDIDEWAIENAVENVNRNNVASRVSISATSVAELQSSSFDLLTANLTLTTNIELLPEFYRVLADNGIVLLSGLLEHDRDTMVQSLTNNRFDLLCIRSEHEWIGIAARRMS